MAAAAAATAAPILAAPAPSSSVAPLSSLSHDRMCVNSRRKYLRNVSTPLRRSR